MKGDIIRKVTVEEYVQGKKKSKLVARYTEMFVNDISRFKAGIW